MLSYKKTILTLILAFTLLPGISLADNSWLVGVWQLSDDSKQEFLEFTADMNCSLVSGKGRKIEGSYKLADSKVKIVYNFKGKKIPIDLSFSDGKDVLMGSLSNTGKAVEYKKK